MKTTREDILDCARDIYLEHGLQGLSMRKVATKVGITPMAIYRHFENKEDLLEQLLIRGFRAFGVYLNRALKGQNALERIQLTIDAYFAFATEQSKYFEIIFLSTDQIKELKVKETIGTEGHATFVFLVDRVRECMEEGVFKQDAPFFISVSLLAQVNGLVSLYLSNTFSWTLEEFEKTFKASLSRTFTEISA